MTLQESNPQIVNPAGELEAAPLFEEFSRKNLKVRLTGAGSKANLGNPLDPCERLISTSRLTALVDYQPEDLTITVQAGLPFEKLQAILGEQGQMLPLDPPELAGQTIGGVLATNRNGPRRLLYGTARDLLIGCRFVLSDGSIGHSGGRVVKNVAGYDLHKLFIGSYGTLGLLTEVTFKVMPQPQYSGVGQAEFGSVEQACQAARQCVRSNLTPSALEIVQQDISPNTPCKLLFAAEGMRVAVDGQLAGLSEICRKEGAASVELLDDGPAVLKAQANLENRYNTPEGNFLQIRVASTLTGLHKVHALLVEIGRAAGGEAQVVSRAGSGLAYLLAKPEAGNLGKLVPLIKKAREASRVEGGSLVIERAPAELWPQLDAWGEFGDATASMRALKDALDPQHLLNPGLIKWA
jgi:glycolate oxidase FAD binding subunit